MGRLFFTLSFLLLLTFGEWYAYDQLNTFFDHANLFLVFYYGTLIFIFWGFYLALTQFRRVSLKRSLSFNFTIGLAFSILTSKWIFALSLATLNALSYLASMFYKNPTEAGGSVINLIPENYTMYGAIGISVIFFMSMLFGITLGKYKYSITHQKLIIPNLPETFNGFRILQISDIHSGSFDSLKQVEKGINLLQKQGPDLIVFTGDLVNFDTAEIDPYIHLFEKTSAPFGKYAIMGNHDYYALSGPSPTDVNKKFADFKGKHERMGFQLLLNEHVQIIKEDHSINLIGVENWGSGPFPKYGDFDKAIEQLRKGTANILLSHDPSHWDEKVKSHEKHIDLTLSGHTHGMQFGINLPWLKWSPVQYRYKKWIGLYEENGQHLYVNRGFGFLGFPGRVFMWPEITVFELHQK